MSGRLSWFSDNVEGDQRLARRGARVVGIDNSEAQLAAARRLQRQHGLDFSLLHGNAEAVPYPDASFDFAISEYGALSSTSRTATGSGSYAGRVSRLRT